MPLENQKFIARIDSALSQNPHLSRRSFRVEAERGRVVLRGQVHTYYQKQMAQEALRHVEGVEHIENQLEVTWETGPTRESYLG